MNVIDLFKEKSDRLAKNRDEFIDMLHPYIKEYIQDAINNARNSQWLSWANDQKKITSAVNAQTNDQLWGHDTSAYVYKMFKQISDNIDEVNYTGEWFELDQQRINQFADVTEDQQWIHTDPERASNESPFRTTIAHGFLTLSLIPKLIGAVNEDKPPYPGAKMVVNLGLNRVRYPYPVKVGSRLRATKKVTKVTPVRRGLEVTEEVTVEIEGCRRPGCVAETVVLLVY